LDRTRAKRCRIIIKCNNIHVELSGSIDQLGDVLAIAVTTNIGGDNFKRIPPSSPITTSPIQCRRGPGPPFQVCRISFQMERIHQGDGLEAQSKQPGSVCRISAFHRLPHILFESLSHVGLNGGHVADCAAAVMINLASLDCAFAYMISFSESAC
jgi:hypothetical protein